MTDNEMKHYILKRAVEISRAEQITKSHAIDKIDKFYRPELGPGERHEWIHIIKEIKKHYEENPTINTTSPS